MAGIKQKFAKFALGHNDFWSEGFRDAGPLPIVLMGIMGAAIGGIGIPVTDAVKGLEDIPQIGQEVALEQYDGVLGQLSSVRAELDGVKGAAHQMPETLGNMLNLEGGDAEAMQSSTEAQARYDQLRDGFVTSVHLDQRLNEEDVRDLITEFETAHGEIEDVTSFDHGLDYNDLNEARLWSEDLSDSSELDKAKAINARADEVNEKEIPLIIGGVVSGLPLLLMLLISIGRRPLTNWSQGRPAVPKSQKFQH